MPETNNKPHAPTQPPAPPAPQTTPSSTGGTDGRKPKADEEPPKLEDDQRIERFRER